MGTIYKITNQINNLSYIGKTIRPVKVRWYEHVKTELYNGSRLHNALLEYGIDNFSFEIIEDNIPNELLDKREQYWIEYYETFTGYGYNMTPGGTGGAVYSKLSLEQVNKIRELLVTTDLSCYNIGQQFNVSASTIDAINSGNNWYDNTLSYPIRKHQIKNYQSVEKSTYKLIVNDLMNTNLSIDNIATKYNKCPAVISSINAGKYCYNGTGYYKDIYSGPFPIRERHNKKVILNDFDKIIYDIIFTNDSMAKIGQKYNLKGNTITYIAIGKRQKELTKDYLTPLRKYRDENQKIYKEKGVIKNEI